MAKSSDVSPQGKQYALQNLSLQPGWIFYVERWAEIQKTEIDEKIFDVATTAAEREILVAARKLIGERYTPEKIISRMQVEARTAAVSRERDEARKKDGE